MWRLVVAELANKCVIKGQRIVFMGTIKALVKAVFVRGQKVGSAFFNAATKPVFRSESARYVLFIQMSKEMWDFDADGSGEIMFNKVINGFLPELFKRWKHIKARHLVTIVLFTRLEYKRGLARGFTHPEWDVSDPSMKHVTGDSSYKDFYRVVVSDMPSTECSDILSQLKKEFKVFLRDVSIRKPAPQDHLSLGTGLTAASADLPDYVIAGRPSAAIRGNILEAINLASSHFSSDYIDRDLVKTGVSIAVITPGTGLFEVDYSLLVKTTDNLIENGIGIDLVCLSRMPLHSVPLFKYREPRLEVLKATPQSHDSHGPQEDPMDTLASANNYGSIASTSVTKGGSFPHTKSPFRLITSEWLYAIPHWVDVSFWVLASDEGGLQAIKARKPSGRSQLVEHQHKAFVPRVRMYELQMMGVMENATSSLSTPYLSMPWKATRGRTKKNWRKAASKSRTAPQSDSLHPTHSGRSANHVNVRPRGLSISTESTDEEASGEVGYAIQWMDYYDEAIFQHQGHSSGALNKDLQPKASYHTSQSYQFRKFGPINGGSSPSEHYLSPYDKKGLVGRGFLDRETKERDSTQAMYTKRASIRNTNPSSDNSHLVPARLSRQISFGLRGFGAVPPKAIASTELSSEHAKSAALLSRGTQPATATKDPGREPSTRKAVVPPQRANSIGSDERSLVGQEAALTVGVGLQNSSSPIPIKKPMLTRITGESGTSVSRRTTDSIRADQSRVTLEILDRSILEEENSSLSEMAARGGADHNLKEADASSAIAPWLTILNPSNPHKTDITLAGRLGRWQHVFPRPLRTSKFKWKSLCSPAAIPFTTEDFPTADRLTAGYRETSYHIDFYEDDISEHSRPRGWRLREMIAFRFSQGFQVVVGPNLAKAMGPQSFDMFDLFANGDIPKGDNKIFMSRGSVVHQISTAEPNKIEVRCFSREPAPSAQASIGAQTPLLYGPSIRTMLDDMYVSQTIRIGSQRQELNWEKVDHFLAGHEKQQSDQSVDNLRSWRARFVLIPVEPPSSARRSLQPVNEDDEEEIRLEGIKKLTQVWQRFRYVHPDERRFQATSRKRKDPNPLDIIYQTRNPSAIVAAELDSTGESDSSGRPVQLLPETELYQRSNLNLASLAQTIQGEKGVRMMDRRWHWRLHYNCFIGFELTTWLLQNFKDVETRDEATELGNELMKGGLFQHVEQRHNFRDGNFFYQVASDYRPPRPESRSNWFGSRRADRSVPPTPGSEGTSRDIPNAPESRSSSNNDPFRETEPTTPTPSKRRLGIALSKSLLYDVDHRKRSYRPELINLHYDRLHNPDNCYHIRIEWMNTTSKLIEDAIVSWATSVDRFGLRLVEVPISEASAVTDMHPFRAPYMIKLTKEPPGKQPQDYFDATSFAPVPQVDKHVYQKEIMKKFNFVLDFEAARDFPSDVDVTYSWGKPNYRYPQYIHRSGVVIAQITDEGHFLLLANRLYNNRSAAPDAGKQDNNDIRDRVRFMPARSGNHRGSPRSSPFSSPLVRATLDMPASTSGVTKSAPNTVFSTPEQIKADFEAFCHDSAALSRFYDEVLSKTLSPAPNTPFMEASIPALGLPPSLTLKEGLPASRSSVKKGEPAGNGSPRSGAVGLG